MNPENKKTLKQDGLDAMEGVLAKHRKIALRRVFMDALLVFFLICFCMANLDQHMANLDQHMAKQDAVLARLNARITQHPDAFRSRHHSQNNKAVK